jgi:hypothetical protein
MLNMNISPLLISSLPQCRTTINAGEKEAWEARYGEEEE